MERWAPAKVNLFLHILGRTETGYHRLQSLMLFASVADRITLADAPSFSFAVQGRFAGLIPSDSSNLVVRTVQHMARLLDRPLAVSLTLEKQVPVGAGLGGGSADAAVAMHALNDWWGRPFSLSQLQSIGLEHGAELPFCLGQSPAFVEGIGEQLRAAPWPVPLAAVLVWPGVALSTREVFVAFAREPRISASIDFDPSDTTSFASYTNDLQDTAISLAPQVGQALGVLSRQGGCRLSRMSGSGSSCFGLFDDMPAAEAAAWEIAKARPDWWVRPVVLGSYQAAIDAAEQGSGGL